MTNNVWDWMSWVTVAILGPGAIVIFLVFLSDLKSLMNRISTPEK